MRGLLCLKEGFQISEGNILNFSNCIESVLKPKLQLWITNSFIQAAFTMSMADEAHFSEWVPHALKISEWLM